MKKSSKILIAVFSSALTVIGLFAAVSISCASADSNTSCDYVPGEMIVSFKDGVSDKKAENILDDMGSSSASEIDPDSDSTTCLVDLPDSADVESSADKYEKNPDIAYAQPNYIYTQLAGTISDDTFSSGQWNLAKIDTRQAWDYIDDNAGSIPANRVKVAILDTGAYPAHEDLTNVLDREHSVDVTSGEPGSYKTYTSVQWGHGTTTAGVLAAQSNNDKGIAGVAAGNSNDLIDLMAIKVFHDEDSSGYINSQASATTADIIKGLDYACSSDAQVIMMCLGHSPSDSDYTGDSHDDDALQDKIDEAHDDYDAVIVCSAGNTGDTSPWYPSDFDNCISAINTTDYSSAFSKCKASNSSYGSKKDISAPGYKVPVTTMNGGYSTGSGTSYAAPTVAAVAAMVRYVNPDLSSDQVKSILYSTAVDLCTSGYDIYTGWGNVNAYSAVTKAFTGTADVISGSLAEPVPSARSNGYKSIKISWREISNANGYYIYRSSSSGGTYSKIKTITSGSTLSWTNSGLKTGGTYYYRIKAYGTVYNKKTWSAMSGTTYAKARPAAPSVSTYTTYRSVKLHWKKISGASGYCIYRSSSKDGSYHLIKSLTKSSSVTWKNIHLKAGKTYYYKVRAYRNTSGGKLFGTYSSVKTCRAAPERVSASLKKLSSSSIRISWKKVYYSDGYAIYRSRSKYTSYKKIKTLRSYYRAFRNSGLKKGRTYYYKVRAYKTVRGKRIYGSYSYVKSRKL